MAKVSITIDDQHPGIVAVFGADSIPRMAALKGYTEVELIPEAELPEKVERPLTQEEIDNGIFGEGVTTVLDYPEGTEFYRPNSETKAVFLGKTILNKNIIPSLLEGFAKAKRAEADAAIADGLKQAAQVIEAAAVIEVVE